MRTVRIKDEYFEPMKDLSRKSRPRVSLQALVDAAFEDYLRRMQNGLKVSFNEADHLKTG